MAALFAALFLALLAALWLWSGQANSLDRTLQWAQRWLPEGHSLSVRGAAGSLRAGGQIAELHWQNGRSSVTASDVRLVWQPLKLLEQQLVIDQLSVGHLQLQMPGEGTPTPMPSSLQLPVQMDAHLRIDALSWQSAGAPQASGLLGHYRFDGSQHRLTLTRARLADGNYQGDLQLGAAAPLPLTIHVQGLIDTQVPGKGKPLTLDAKASITGPLGNANPSLDMQASIQGRSPTDAMQATLMAQWQPWAPQAFAQLEAQFSGLNLAALWPQAPLTQATGHLTILPLPASANQASALAWLARGSATNALPGPWDQKRLPLSSLQVDLSHDLGAWQVRSLQATVDGGQLRAQGRLTSGVATAWEGHAEVRNLNPAALHSRLAPDRLQGTISARSGDQGLEFQGDLRSGALAPSAPHSQSAGQTKLPAPAQGLHLRRVQTRGVWSAPWLRLSALEASTTDATLNGTVSVNTHNLSLEGQLAFRLPGGNAHWQGALSETAGQGNLNVTLADLAAARQWVATLPDLPALPALAALARPTSFPPPQGLATLKLTWRGGWRPWTASPADTAAGEVGALGTEDKVHLNAQLLVPRLTLPATPTQGEQLAQDVTVSLSGTPDALQLAMQGQLRTGEQLLRLDSAALWTQGSAGNWQAQLAPTTLALFLGGESPPWTLRTQQPLSLHLSGGLQNFTLRANAGQAVLSGPPPGSVAVHWQPAHWQHNKGKNHISTDGHVSGLPLKWLEHLAQSRASATVLRGDLVLDGAWRVKWAETLSAQLSLERSKGELRLQTDDQDAGIEAGIRAARLALDIEDEQVRAKLDWDSLRAGQLQADLRSQLTRDAQGWHWRPQAPLAGQVQAQLPQLGVWSVLAPPGWRVRGTLDAKLTLSGTRAQPQWQGQVNADQLALRSVAEGIEFSQGELRALLHGQSMDIQRFRLLGAGGATGGELIATGNAQWLPGSAPAAGPGLTLEAEARKLKVSARADRRLVVSGQVRLNLTPRRLMARGKLRADQALFLLPEEDTPSLGRDVVVRSGKAPSGILESSAPAQAPGGGTPTQPDTDIDLTLDAGDDFQVRGRGLSTRLAGSVRLLRLPHEQAPRLNGELRTVGGTYKAYGQQLDIEQGVLRFSGPYDNPGLHILALRPHLVVTVGVQVTGSVLSPRVRLYADPELPEAEKLAWLVLGRGAASGGAEAAVLQQAAVALLGGAGQPLSGGLAEALGLDELSFRGATYSDAGTAAGVTMTLGKRLSRDFYVAFERGLAGTVGTVYIFYNLSRRLTLRAQTGEQSAIDVILTVPYD